MEGFDSAFRVHRSAILLGTNTGVGKSTVFTGLVKTLRRAGQKVWVHKPIACGGWDGASAEDGRLVQALVADGQSLATACPLQFPEPCSPHLAAAVSGVEITLTGLIASVPRPPPGTWLLVEGAGGVCSPLTSDRRVNADLAAALGLPTILITRSDLGTLSATLSAVESCRSRGVELLGLVLNRPQSEEPGLATARAAEELVALCGLPLLADLAHGGTGDLTPVLEAISGCPFPSASIRA